jgi:hypothetical protein
MNKARTETHAHTHLIDRHCFYTTTMFTRTPLTVKLCFKYSTLPVFQTGFGSHPASCTMGTGSFPGVKCGRAVPLTTHPFLAPRSWKSRAIPLPPSGPQPGYFTGLLYLYLYTFTLSVLFFLVHSYRS